MFIAEVAMSALGRLPPTPSSLWRVARLWGTPLWRGTSSPPLPRPHQSSPAISRWRDFGGNGSDELHRLADLYQHRHFHIWRWNQIDRRTGGLEFRGDRSRESNFDNRLLNLRMGSGHRRSFNLKRSVNLGRSLCPR